MHKKITYVGLLWRGSKGGMSMLTDSMVFFLEGFPKPFSDKKVKKKKMYPPKKNPKLSNDRFNRMALYQVYTWFL